ncbi:MAG: aminotransferase class V-fold PLP-dependent enzyme [Pseudomonadota bacterium]
MSLSNGRALLAIPGPSVVPDAVLRAMHRGSPNIYEGELVDMMPELTGGLRHVAGTKHDVAIYIGNGHAAWEAALSNTIAPGETVLVPSTGRFAHGWAEIAQGIGAEAQILEFGTKDPMDADRIEAVLRADTERQIKAVLAVHVDTSSSIRSDIAAVRAAMDAAGHPALLMADCMASLGCDQVDMDGWGVDVMVAGCQKGLMVPAGMAFVYFGPKAAEARARLERVSWYWDWVPRANPEIFFQHFGGTAPTHHLYGLQVALRMIAEEGLEAIWARHAAVAQAVWAACEAWSEGGPLTLNVPNRAHRSHAVTSLRLGAPYGTDLRRWTEHKAGVTLGIGLGMSEPEDPAGDGFFRIGHMGHVNAQMILATLASMQGGFDALGIPYGPGAIDAAIKVIAKAA